MADLEEIPQEHSLSRIRPFSASIPREMMQSFVLVELGLMQVVL